MENFDILLKKYADFIVRVGVNPQPGQTLIINCCLEAAPLARLCVRSAYEAGARDVLVNWSDNDVSRSRMELGSEEAMVAFCRGIQAAAPVDSFAAPMPWDMPGYDSPVIMAAGAFVQGSSIELSADGPIRPPYAVYFQGGLTWNHAKLGILMSLQKLCEAGLVQL